MKLNLTALQSLKGFISTIGSGNNANVLHYIEKTTSNKVDLILIDAGAE
jgi:Xaa-Pro aminopeptidase